MGLFQTIEKAGEMTVAVNPVVGGVIAVVGKVLDNLFPDPAQRAQAALELERLQDGKEARELAALLQVQMGQIDVNKVEAASDSLFKSGWRPNIGWICGAALGWNFIVRPAIVTGMALYGHPVTLPPADMAELMPVLLGMLGLGGLRTIEKLKGAT